MWGDGDAVGADRRSWSWMGVELGVAWCCRGGVGDVRWIKIREMWLLRVSQMKINDTKEEGVLCPS
jgi:hypothetical protein